MQLKAARSAGALYLLSPVAVPGLALKTRGDAHLYNDFFAEFSQRASERTLEERWPASTRVNRLVGQTDMQRDCGVSWRYQAWVLKNSLTRKCSKNLRNRKPYNPRSLFWWTFSIPKISAILRERVFSTATPRYHSSAMGQNSFPWRSDIGLSGRFALHAACWL
jgi:hypothetical protein